MNTPRGISNNNPGNIRWGSDWKGLKRTGNSKICPFVYLKRLNMVFGRWPNYSGTIRGFIASTHHIGLSAGMRHRPKTKQFRILTACPGN